MCLCLLTLLVGLLFIVLSILCVLVKMMFVVSALC